MSDQRELSAIIYQLEDTIDELEDEKLEIKKQEETEELLKRFKELDDNIELLWLKIEDYSEQLTKLENAAVADCEYDGWDEVFTGGDY